MTSMVPDVLEKLQLQKTMSVALEWHTMLKSQEFVYLVHQYQTQMKLQP